MIGRIRKIEQSVATAVGMLLMVLFWVATAQAGYYFEQQADGWTMRQIDRPNLSAAMDPVLKADVLDDELYVALNGSTNQLYSMTKWVENTLNSLIQYVPFQNKVMQMLRDLVNDPATPEIDALLDTSLSLPLFGDVGLGFHIQDIYNTGTGPNTIPLSAARAADAFADADTEAITVNWAASFATVSPVGAQSTLTPLLPLAAGVPDYNGSLNITITLSGVNVDVMLRQPDYPKYVTAGHYVHAMGKISVPSLVLDVNIYTIGGNFAADPIEGGFGIGLDVDKIHAEGGITFDYDEFDCRYNGADIVNYTTTNRPFCDAYHSAGPGPVGWVLDRVVPHPDCEDPATSANNCSAGYSTAVQTRYQNNTNTSSDTLAEVVQFLQGEVLIDAQRSSLGSVQQFLTAMEVTDLTWMTHDRDINGINASIGFDHPFENNAKIWLDYGLMYRWHGHGAADGGIDLPGGFAFGVTGYNNPRGCSVAGSAGASPVTLTHGRLKYSSLNPNGFTAAMIGAGVHINTLNKLIDNVWRSAVLCMDFWKNTKGLGDTLAPIFTVNQFKMFLPSLAPAGNRDMMIKVKPRYSNLAGGYVKAVDQPKFILNPGDPAKLIVPSGNPGYIGPFDLQLSLPHLETLFSVDTVGDSAYTSFTDIFSADVDLNVYAALGWYKTTSSPNGGTACDVSPWPCRILHLGFHLDPQVNEIKAQTLAGTLNGASLNKAIASIFPLILSGEYEGSVSAALNTNPSSVTFLGLVIDPAAPGDLAGFGQGSGIKAVDADGDVDADYLGAYFKIGDLNGDNKADVFDPQMIVDMLVDFGLFPAPANLDRKPYDPFARFRTGDNNVVRHISPETFVKTWSNDGVLDIGVQIDLTAEQTRAAGISSLGGSVFVAPDSVEYGREGLALQYRLDRGVYSIPQRSGEIKLGYLFDGKHQMEVFSIDQDGYIDSSPAVINFVVDSQPPVLRWIGAADDSDTSVYRRELSVIDAVSRSDEIVLSVRVDRGNWEPVQDPHEIYVASLSPGAHTVEVRAVDGGGNVATMIDTAGITAGGFGCSTTGGNSPLSFVLLLVLPLAYLGVSRRWQNV